MFISFEGIDKSGKSTQASLLFEYLKKKGYSVIKTCEPGGTQIGKEIEKILLFSEKEIDRVSELFLFLADRAYHVKKVIEPALKKREIVISERFIDATVAYQGYGRGLSISWLKELNKIATGDIFPDITFLLDINPLLSRKRAIKRDRIEKEEIEFHQRVREGYLEIAKASSERIKVIQGDVSPEEIHNRIKKFLFNRNVRKGEQR